MRLLTNRCPRITLYGSERRILEYARDILLAMAQNGGTQACELAAEELTRAVRENCEQRQTASN
jgi:hypothetical protein